MNPLQRRLAALRRRLRLVVSLQGIGWLGAFLVGCALVAGLVDSQAALPGVVRAFLLVGILGGGGALGYCFLFRPLWARVDDLSLALKVESCYPVLNDALASTVQFLEQPANSELAGSPSLRREAVQQAMRRAQGCDFNKVVPSRGLWPAGAALLVSAGLAVTLVLILPALAWTAFLRLADPFGEHDWPTDTQLVVKYRERVPAGQPLVIQGEVHGEIPKSAVIEFDGLGNEKEPVKLPIQNDEKSEGGTFEYTVDVTAQQGDFQFRITANDAASPKKADTWHHVTVVQPPEVADLTCRAEYPAYTDKPAENLVEVFDSPSPKEIVLGTRLIIHGVADRPLARVFITCEPNDPRRLVTTALLVPLAGRSPLDGLALWRGIQSVGEPVPARLEGDRTHFALEFMPSLSGHYHLVWMDAEDLGQQRILNLKVDPDPAPRVELECRSLAPRSTLVTAKATLALHVRATDENAVRSVALEYRRKDQEGKFLDADWQRIPLYESLYEGLAALPIPLIKPAFRQEPKVVVIDRRWSIEGLVEEGQVLVLSAVADDFDDFTPDKRARRSTLLELRIAKPADVKADVQKAIIEVRNELNRVNDAQAQALDKIRAAEKQLRTTGRLRKEDAKDLVKALEQNQRAQDRIGKNDSEKLQKDVQRIRNALADNKLPRSAATDKMDSVARSLTQIADHLTRSQEKVQKILKDEEEPDKRPPAKKQQKDLAGALRHQQDAQDVLEGLLTDLSPFTTLQEMQGRAQQLRREQEEILQQTDKLRERTQKLPTLREKEREAEAQRLKMERLKLAEKQRQLAGKTDKLLRQMEQTVEAKKQSDQRLADKLGEAAKRIRQESVPVEMGEAAKILDPKKEQADPSDPNNNNQQPENIKYHDAIKKQREAIKNLERAIGAMDERREQELDRLTKKQKEEQQALNQLRGEMERLKKKVKEAQKIKNDRQRREALKKLGAEQQRLQKKVDEMVKRLTRMRADEAAEELRRASQKMDEALRQMDNGEDPEKQQEDALARLNEAEKKLQKANNEVENELARERLAKVADQIKRLKDRQEAALRESARIQKELLEQGKWDEGLVGSLSTLKLTRQGGLATETASLAKKLADARVFNHILQKTVTAMQNAVKRIEQRQQLANEKRDRENPTLTPEEIADEKKADAETQKYQKEASRRLDRLLDALKNERGGTPKPPNQDPPPDGGGGQGGGGEQGGGPPPMNRDGIPTLAELKALKAEQEEVNERTRDFDDRHPELAKLPPERKLEKLQGKDREELKQIHDDQEKVHELARQLFAEANQQGEKR
jgi:hypothetical protein